MDKNNCKVDLLHLQYMFKGKTQNEFRDFKNKCLGRGRASHLNFSLVKTKNTILKTHVDTMPHILKLEVCYFGF